MRHKQKNITFFVFAVLIVSFFCAQTASALNYSGGSYDGYSSGSNGYMITPSAGANGTISPGTATVVQLGASQPFTIEAMAGYHIDTVRVDGAATSEGQGASSYTYIFSSVNAIHTIEALFAINTYAITSEAGSGGTIEPIGITIKDYGSSQAYTITPNANYVITSVFVDGSSEGAVSSYTFNSISGNHRIIASFEIDSSKNLLTNGDAQTGDFTGWTTHNYGSGWANGDIGGGNRAFVSSYYNTAHDPTSATDYCNMYQEIDLVSKGYSPSYLDSVPRIDISSSVYPGTVPSWYRVTVELRDAGHNVIASYDSGHTSLTAHTILSSTFTGYGPGLRYIYFWQGGHDNPWWGGNYGAQFDNSVVLVAQSPVFTVEASSGPNGTIYPAGSIVTGEGFNVVLHISAEAGYKINALTIDGSVTTEGAGLADYTYTFRNISANHSIEAGFAIRTFTITSEAGVNGSIEPLGITGKNYGTNQTYTIIPGTGYHVSDVLVDGGSVGATTEYTFSNITTNHTISASFEISAYLITSEAGSHGTIEPLGMTGKNYGTSQSYVITPDTGYHISDVFVDSVSVGATTEYIFSNITANHRVIASFEIDAFLITSEAGANGAISPLGTTAKNYGSSQTYTITPDSGYEVSDVLVDSISVGAVVSYTFGSIEANHLISATFKSSINAPSAEPFSNVTSTVIRANWGANGNPSGTEYYCENITAGTNSGWVTGLNWTSSSLEVSTVYAFRVKARSSASSESGWTSLGSRETMGYESSEASVAGVSLKDGDTISSILTITVSLTGETSVSSASIKPLATMGGIKEVLVDGVAVAYDILSSSDTEITIRLRSALSVGTHTIKVITYDTAGTEYVLERTGLVVMSGSVVTVGPTLLYPNPYDPLAGDLKITYYLSVDKDTVIYVVDTSGRIAWKSNYLSGTNGGKAGYNEVTWNSSGIFGQLASGAYVVSLMEQGTGKMITKTKLLLWKGGAR